MILVGLSLRQDLANQAQPIRRMELCNLRGWFVQRAQVDLGRLKAAGADSLQKYLQRIIPHLPLGFAKNQIHFVSIYSLSTNNISKLSGKSCVVFLNSILVRLT